MKKQMLDTNICIYIIKNKPQNVREKLKEFDVGDLVLSSITVSELYYGVYKSEYMEKNLLALEHFLKPFDILEYDIKASAAYGKIRADLEKRGQIIGGLDMMIAAHALSCNMTLVTNNTKEFKRVKELRIDNWVYNI
ncbi:MAG: type II toxin-antitoxin system VapC family toxin [Sulfurimonas sp.]|uniref:type II toxin-antitoxin system tRNA(fMet)-specific endonuclease VapC n=1 Tax=Sulfurimonas sp. TaxID=2022749 RepID=UPI00260452C5|nr:type II toxin-antitoxin system VapC family toxin [Sulfurimonas sp.]MDD5372026.1 type II toxin-antitoxin system VapC family toxin [Sulfurimonas sp.]